MYFYFFIGWVLWMVIAFNLFLASCLINKSFPRSYDEACMTAGACLLWLFTMPYEIWKHYSDKRWEAQQEAELLQRLAADEQDHE